MIILAKWFSGYSSKNTLYGTVVLNNKAWYSKRNPFFHEITCFGRNFDLNVFNRYYYFNLCLAVILC